MISSTCKYINLTDEHPCESLIEKILYCEKLNGKHFVARLIGIKGEMLVFETKTGKIILDRFDSLRHISEMTKQVIA